MFPEFNSLRFRVPRNAKQQKQAWNHLVTKQRQGPNSSDLTCHGVHPAKTSTVTGTCFLKCPFSTGFNKLLVDSCLVSFSTSFSIMGALMHLTMTRETARTSGPPSVDLAFARVLWQLGVEIPDPHRGISTARGQFRGVRGERYAQHCLALRCHVEPMREDYPKCYWCLYFSPPGRVLSTMTNGRKRNSGDQRSLKCKDYSTQPWHNCR